MGKIEFRVCDRCGKKLGAIIYRAKWRRFTLMYRTPSAYDYGDYDFELCRDCGRAVDAFIRKPPEEGANV